MPRKCVYSGLNNMAIRKESKTLKSERYTNIFLTCVSKCRKNNHYSFHHKCDVGRIVGSLDL